jgi:hypothetical protein
MFGPVLDHYERVKHLMAPPYHERQVCHVGIVLDKTGRYLDAIPLGGLDDRGRPAGVVSIVGCYLHHQRPPNLLFDIFFRIFGASPPKTPRKQIRPPTDQMPLFFLTNILDYLEWAPEGVDTTAQEAVAKFMGTIQNGKFLAGEGHKNAKLDVPRIIAKLGNYDRIVFIVDGKFAHDDDHVREFWSGIFYARDTNPDVVDTCMYCGQQRPIPKLVPAAFAEDKILSAQQSAFRSHGFGTGNSAPICLPCSLKVNNALRHLLSDPQTRANRELVGPRPNGKDQRPLWVYFTTGAATDFRALAFDPEPESVQAFLADQNTEDLTEPDQCYAFLFTRRERRRLTVLAALSDTVPNCKRNLARFFAEQQVGKYYGVSILTWSLVQRPPVPDEICRHLVERALFGKPLPLRVFSMALSCAKREPDKPFPTHRRAVINLYVADWVRGENMSRTELHNQPAHIAGRLFCVYENLQYAALGETKASVLAKHFRGAIARPARHLGQLDRKSAAWLNKLKGFNRGAYEAIRKEIADLYVQMDLHGCVPEYLSDPERTVFLVGRSYQEKLRRLRIRARQTATLLCRAEKAFGRAQEAVKDAQTIAEAQAAKTWAAEAQDNVTKAAAAAAEAAKKLQDF